MSTTADIQKYGRNRDGYIEYFIKVVHNGKVWGIKKRYSEFVTLNEYLIKSGYTNVPTASLPKKTTVWKKVDDKLLQKRSKALQIYLNELLKTFSVVENSLLKEFLEVEVNWLKSAKQQSFQKVQRMDVIPLTFSKLVIQIPMSRVKTSPFLRGGTGGGGGFGGTGGGTMGSFSVSTMNKTKSLSFSMMRSPSRKESFQPTYENNSNISTWNPSSSFAMGGSSGINTLSSTPQFSGMPTSMKDRKFSMDIFNLSANNNTNSNSYDVYALQSAVKKSAFIKATDTLWNYYRDDIQQLCDEGDEDIEYDSSYFDAEDEHDTRPMGPGMGMLRRPGPAGESSSSGGGGLGKAKIMTMASLTNANPVDYQKMHDVLSSSCSSSRQQQPAVSDSLLVMKEIAMALTSIELKCIQSHMQLDPFHWNDEVIVYQEFDQVPRLLAEKEKEREKERDAANRSEDGDDLSVGKISISSTITT